jgi:predicted RNA-binding Zn-ribbon protein involved in translation (DUF1610 family)
MKTIQTINCPNCGSSAKRIHYRDRGITEIACPVCDYLLIKCSRTCRVLEAYAPGIASNY